MKAGGKLTQQNFAEALMKRVSPGGAMYVSPTGTGPSEGGKTREVGPGDVVAIPAGTVHEWQSIPTEVRYIIIVRLDPEKQPKAGFVQPLLKR